MQVPSSASIVRSAVVLGLLIALAVAMAGAQQSDSTVPTLVNFSGTLTDVNGKPLTGVAGVTFYLYKDEQGGSPLWIETQNVTPDKYGHYAVVLGSTTSQGLPTDLFASGQARWLAVQAEGQAEQPRVLLVSVPYALKAGDAQTIGGLPASAFLLANGSKEGAATASSLPPSPAAAAKNAPPANPNVTGRGVVDFIPMWDTTSDIVDSIIFQKSSAIGIATTTPAATLDVNGKSDVRDTLTLFPKGTDPTLAISGTAFKVDQTGKVTFISGQKFPGSGTITGVTTAGSSGLQGGGTSGTLNLSVKPSGVTNAMLQHSNVTLNANSAGGLTTPGAMTLGSTYTIGLKPCSTNQILEYSGSAWNCSSAGTGTINGVTAGSDLTGGGTSGNVTLNLDTTKVPLLSAANAFTNMQTIATNNSTQVVNVTQNGSGAGVASVANGGTGLSGTGNIGVNAIGGSGSSIGVQAASAAGWAVFANTTSGLGVFSISSAPNAVGSIEGYANSNALDASTPGVTGYSTTGLGVGTRGLWSTASTIGGSYGYASGVWGDSSSGYGVIGTSDSSEAVVGRTGASNATTAAILGITDTSSGSPVGVYGWNGLYNPGVGVFGQVLSESTTGQGFMSAFTDGTKGVGVWGDGGYTGGGTNQGYIGVAGTMDDGNAGFFVNNSPSTYYTVMIVSENSATAPLNVYNSGTGKGCYVDASGNINCSGSKNAVVPIDGGTHTVALSAIESPVNWFEDAGSAELVNGVAVVALDPEFTQTVNAEMDYKVFPVPNGDCRGLYVTNKTATSFEVRELGSGVSNVRFDYRIMALRKNYENIRFADHTHDQDGIKQALERAKTLHLPPQSHDPQKRPLRLASKR